MKVGWIGLGNMGVPMVRNIAAAGIDIQAYNRTSKPDLELGSARLCTSLEDAVKDVDVVVLMLSNGQAVDDVLFAQDAVTYLRPNTLVVNMSTIGVDETLEINARLRERGHRFVDAPVLGSVKPAEDGTLTVVAGGDTEDIQALSSLFEAVSKVYFHIGEVSKGATMKLLVNAFLGMTIEALGECISFGTRNQLPKELMFDVLATSAVWAPTLAAKREMVIHDKYDAQFALKHLSKDLGLAMRQASESKVPLPAIHATRNVFLEAEQQGYGALDMSAVVQYLQTKQGQES